MKKKPNQLLYHYLFPYAGLILVRLLSLTYRVRIIDSENETSIRNRGGGIVYASWHQRFFPGITFFSRRRPIAIMISHSRDGEMISRVVDVLGWLPVRGSSSRGGSRALQEIKKLARQGFNIGHIVDGPRGPFGVVKPGLLRIAQASGLPIIPTITSSFRPFVFNSWDRFMVPRPFSRVIIRFGRPVFVQEGLTPEEFETKRQVLETTLNQLYARTDALWKSSGSH
ncbi:lysophospholipid acyltransferase family protein [Desulfocicer niacini]